jgi:DNA-binding XRE family transcriptional regulator
VAIVKVQEAKAAERNDPMRKYAVMTQEEVAKRLGCTPQNVRLIEQRALRKLRAKPELKKAWADLLASRPRVQYDPFHEIWLFQVAETIATNHRHAVDETDVDSVEETADEI